MTISRRSLGAGIAGLLAGPLVAAPANAQAPPPTPPAAHDMHAMPPHWVKAEKIAFLVYPQFTALDMVGPHHMLTSLMGASVQVVARTREPVVSDSGLVVVPTATFAECPADLDILCVPGGTTGTLAAIDDAETMAFVRDRGSRARYVTSVCTGALVIGAAGLLKGYRATTHWAAKDILPSLGATPAPGRVVVDRNRITGGGVTAGIDFGLLIVGMLRDRQYAEAVQLMAEYAPEPPYAAGTPATAPADVKAIIDPMFTGFLKDAEARSRAAFERLP